MKSYKVKKLKYLLPLLIVSPNLFAEVCIIANGQDASTVIQACIDNAIENSTVEIPVGTYLFQKEVIVHKALTITTEGKLIGDSSCHRNTQSCTELKAGRRAAIFDGLFQLNASGIVFRHLRINGNQDVRKKAIKNICKDTHRTGMNISVNNHFITVTKIASYDNPCGSNLEIRKVDGSTLGVQITENNIVNSGKHDTQWSDGIGFHGAEDSIISGNNIQNATDIGLIFGHCINCEVSNNIISNLTDNLRGSFGGILVYSWEKDGNNNGGDYTSTIFKNNVIRGGKKNSMGFGILVGGRAWEVGKIIKNVTLDGNKIINAQHALVIDSSARNIIVKNQSIKVNWSVKDKFSATCNDKLIRGTKYLVSPEATNVSAENTVEGYGVRIGSKWDISCIPNVYRK